MTTPSEELHKSENTWHPKEAPPPSHIETLAPGAHVSISVRGGKDLPGLITGVGIYHRRIAYRVVWWDGETRKEAWLETFEVWPHPKQATLVVGFNPDPALGEVNEIP